LSETAQASIIDWVHHVNSEIQATAAVN
jgi:hypothetical protein